MAVPSFIFGGDTGETPESIKRKREIANALARGALSNAPKDIGSGLSAIGQALIYRKMMKDADKAETGFKSEAQADADALIGGFGGAGSAKPSSASGGAYGGALPLPGAAGEVGTNMPDDLKSGIKATAESLGISPVDLATAISYETGGTFDPVKSGPTTQWGKHRGLIQFGEPQAEKYGVDWNNPVGSQLGPDGAVAKYLRDTGVKPGMGMLDIYSAINAGGVGRYNASDANNGGAPGTVRDKVEKQMGGHRAKALAMFGGDQVASLDPSAGMTAADAINAIAPTQQQRGPEQAYVDPAVKVVNPVAEALAKGSGAPAVPPAVAQALASRGQQRGATIGDPSMTFDENGARMAAEGYSRPQPQNPYSGPGAQIGTPMPVYDEQGMRMHPPMPAGQAMAAAPGNAPPLPPPQAIPPQPPVAGAQQSQGQQQAMPQPQSAQAPVEVAQAAQGDMGHGYFPAAPSAPGQPGPSVRQIMRVLQNPYSSPEVKAIAAQQLEKMQQANDPAYQQQQQLRQMQMEKGRLEIEALRNPQAKIPESVQALNMRAQQAGLVPGSPEYQQFMISGGKEGTNITVNTGEGDKFFENLDKKNAETFAAMSDTGIQARAKIAQIDRLQGLMANAPQGAVGVLKQAAGEWGIPTDGLSDIQAASSLLEKMVPAQRAPGSGTMSDADIKMFRASLPRILNQPGGNQLIFDTMRGIAQYEMQMGEIADQVADRTIKPAEGRKLIRELRNPLADFKPPEGQATPNEGRKTSTGATWSIDE